MTGGRLTPEQQEAFRKAVDAFIEDLRRSVGFRKGLRVKRIRRSNGVWEMTWAPDGRATWQYGEEMRPGEPHIIWRRIGTHSVLDHA